jgi:hypothetical protein
MPQKYRPGNEKLQQVCLQKKTETTEDALVLRYFQLATGREIGFFEWSHDIKDGRMTSALTPQERGNRSRLL